MTRAKEVFLEENRIGYFSRRIFAFAIDWYISSVLLNLIIRLSLIFSGLGDMQGNIITYNMATKIIIVIASLLVSFFYFVYIPYKSKSKSTPMMKAMKLEILNIDGTKPQFKTLFIRFFIGCFFLQGVLYSSFNTIMQTITKGMNINSLRIIDYATAITLSVITIYSIIISIRDKKYNQTIHDKMSKTYVVSK